MLFVLPFLLVIISADFRISNDVSAYPAPEQSSYPVRNAYPAPDSSPTAPPSLPANFNPTDHLYLPSIRKDPSARFSVSGAGNEARVLEVVPQGVQIDPYIWDRLPNNNSSIQMIRACTYYRNKSIKLTPFWHIQFSDWYWPSKVGHLCWDPITQEVAKIVNEPACPYYALGRPCLDVEISFILNTGESEFRAIVQGNPNWVWLIGNEPDGVTQDALVDTISIGNSMITNTVTIGGPNAYAIFFKTIYEIVDEEINSQPRLAFCQSTIAWNDPDRPNFGLNYCQQAFNHLKTFGYGPGHVYALATHQYMHEPETFGGISYAEGRLLDGETRPIPGDNRTVLEHAVERWEEYLQQFEAWAESEGMGDKSLWLTEYGSPSAWCYEVHSGGDYEAGGVGCPATGKNHVFYGRNSHEGLWGLQKGQMAYLARPDNDWQAAWWFVSTMGDWNNDGFCDHTAWLWRADFDCRQDSTRPNNLSRAGEIHMQTLACLFNGQNCPPSGVVNTHDSGVNLPPLEGPYCKADSDLLCLPHASPPSPTPTPTATPVPTLTPTPVSGICDCSGSGPKNGDNCLPVVCPPDE